jgi:eukaryotic-like serine/threonine-protein kinase
MDANTDPSLAREREIFLAALERPSPGERAAFLDGACGNDAPLRARLESLLRHHLVDSFLEEPAPDLPRTPPCEPVIRESIGAVIGRYKLLQKIGEGGMGVVYMAEQEEPVRRRVALKIIKLGMDTKQVVARFEAERQALALMDHPNIAKVLDGGATDTGRPYFVMELVQGVPITEFCHKNRLGAQERIKLFIVVCQAIQSAHQKSIIHRDLKPTNILVTLNAGLPVPMVIDFGVAKATQQKLTEKTVFTNYATMIGTPAYMSPEQAEMSRLDVDTRSDIYGLGVLLYELLTGTTPFPEKRLRSASYLEMQRIIMEEEPERPSTRLRRALITASPSHRAPTSREGRAPRVPNLSSDLDWIVMKCLEKDRVRRYETANGLAADLKRHLDNEPVIARPPSAAYRFQKLVRRNKLAFAAGTAVAAALLVGLALSTFLFIQERRAHDSATRAEKLAAGRLIESENARKEAEANATLAKQRLEDSEAISKFLTEVFQSPDPARDGRTITVAETLSNATKKLETELTNQPPRRAKLQVTLGATYYALGLYREAIPLQEKVRDYYLAAFGPEHTNTISAMHKLAGSYAEAGRRDEALKLREQVLALRRKVNGPEHTDTLMAMNNLAISYDEAGRRDEALKLREQVLPLQRKVNGPEHSDTLHAMHNLASSYAETGRRDEALKLREQVLALRLKVNGPERPDTLKAMNNLASSYYEAGRVDEALKLQEEALALYRKVIGPEHPDTLHAMRDLANSYDGAGRRDEALKLREEALALYRKVLGPQDPVTLGGMQNLAVSYLEAGRLDEGLKMQEEVLALLRQVSGPEDPRTLVAIGNLAETYYHLGRWNEALKLREQVLALRRKVNGPDHPDTINAMNSLAVSFYHAGRLNEAIKLLEEALALWRNVSGPDHRAMLLSMNNLAAFYDDAGRREEALRLREEVLALLRQVSGPEDPRTLVAIGNLAESYYHLGRWNEELKLREQVLEFSRKANGPEHTNTLGAMNNLASAYDNDGRQDEALKLREQVLALARKVLGPEDPQMIAAMDNLTLSYSEAGRQDEAIKLGEEVLVLSRKVNGLERSETLNAMHNLANSYDRAGRRDEALKLREQVLALRRTVNSPEHPDTLRAMARLADSYDEAGRSPEALKMFEEVLALRRKVLGPKHPDTLETLNTIAWTWAASNEAEIRNGTRAVNYAEQAVAATHRTNAAFLNTLAAAYAETQQFDKAVAAQQEAIGLLKSQAEKKDYESRLKLYQANKPYRARGSP